MSDIERYSRPESLAAALKAAAADPKAVWIAGGSSLLSGDYAQQPESVIDVSAFIPRGLAQEAGELRIGAGTTFQELVDSRAAPSLLRDAALGIVSRNVRNRATVGGNIASDRSCSSLIPSLLVLDAEVEFASSGEPGSPGSSRRGLQEWLDGPVGLILSVIVRTPPASLRSAYGRWGRSSGDAAMLGAALSFVFGDGTMRDLRIALGGISGKSRRMPPLEERFEGWRLPASSADVRAEVEAAALPLLAPAQDGLVTASFKRLRAAALLADVVVAALAAKEVTQA